MAHAFVLVRTAAGESAAVHEAAGAVDGVSEAHVVAGPWDIVLEVAADEVNDLLDVVATDVGHLDAVNDTRTYVSLESR